jgi:glycosyltransferase involved in cell wall biosynthesis
VSVSVLIPAYNEAERIAATVEAALALPGITEVVVIDDGSTDATGSLAETAGAHVVTMPRNGGKAAALMAGGQAATGAYLLLLDADLGPTAREAAKLLPPVLSGEAGMSIATFPVVPGRGGGAGIVVRTARQGIQRATGRTMAAPLSGQRCLSRAAWDVAQPLAPGFGVETALTIAVLRAGFVVVEIETRMDHRVTQNDWRGRLHRLRQLRDVLRALRSTPR